MNDRAWVTAAETCEATLAYLSVGDRRIATELFEWSQQLRDSDGRYWTGRVFPQDVHFPPDEKSTYTSAAVILAADALADASPAALLLTDHDFLPDLIGMDEPVDEPSLD